MWALEVSGVLFETAFLNVLSITWCSAEQLQGLQTSIHIFWYYLNTSFNPQNLRNIIKKVAKISIIQILITNLSVKTTVFCYFFAAF